MNASLTNFTLFIHVLVHIYCTIHSIQSSPHSSLLTHETNVATLLCSNKTSHEDHTLINIAHQLECHSKSYIIVVPPLLKKLTLGSHNGQNRIVTHEHTSHSSNIKTRPIINLWLIFSNNLA